MLSQCDNRMEWPQRGVYFFREHGEARSDTGKGNRIVRIGTHALKARANTTLWKRLSQHKGHVRSGGGNHRGSIFRLIVGTALIGRNEHNCPTWGCKITTDRDLRQAELPLEQAVSKVLGVMPFLWLDIDDEAGPNSRRGYIESNSIALLSNHDKMQLDPPSRNWLGYSCNRPLVKSSGLWNQNHVKSGYDPAFLDKLEEQINKMAKLI